MSDLVFLGAGASRPFEIPTMKEMVTEFEKEVKSSEPKLFQYYTEIKDTLLKAFGNTNIDIEAILSVIEGISKDVKPQDLGHFASYYISKMGPAKQFSNEELESAKKLLEKLKEYIKNSCTVKLNENTEVYKNSYIPLFEILSGKKRQTFYDEFNLALDWKAYTTNYDLVFEGFWDNLARPIDHFDKPSDSDNYVFSNRLELGLHSFVKLHGSLDWTYNKKTRALIRKKNFGFRPYETEGDVMLFPIQQKDLYLFPWSLLFQDFRYGLRTSEQWYVIGYAFNDEFIRNVFVEALKNKNKPCLIIISQHAKDIVNKFPEEVRSKIIPLPFRFATKYFSLQIHDFVEGCRTLTVKLKTSSPLVVFKSNIPIVGATLSKMNGDEKNIAATIHTENDWVEFDNLSNDNKEMEFELKIEHKSPFKNDLELQVGFNGVFHYDFSLHIDDHFLGSVSGSASTQDQDLQIHLSKPIKIFSDSLFVNL